MRIVAVLCCCLALSAQAETFSARVIAVMDGDTVMVLRQGQRIKIRLANIDAPEKDQPFGPQSRDSMLEMVDKKQVQVDSQAVDQYGRIVGLLSVNGLSVNQAQVKRGMAWEYSHYHSDKTYLALQSEAQRLRLGLWSQAQPVPPWQWRELHPSVLPAGQIQSGQYGARSHAAPVKQYDASCDKKHLCSQMESCEEANFYFMHCGIKTLDGNHDGMPCESLCEKKD
ncbi:thermonuclease family protein [Sideroxydans lithotrophicus]|uniref:Nuclease (SNase domain protein) n=1 Tax=Sideroxydans lithotrophicus (strain ES-1) TaxID=580332 RepID=D5CNI6_SIDLE|nr:thermonuclease family protein [Sideroxydans lithotrophicus]ADE10899.1 nuclease (SNase domain protein) [Sideroxydans lithotrophicus ES-1]